MREDSKKRRIIEDPNMWEHSKKRRIIEDPNMWEHSKKRRITKTLNTFCMLPDDEIDTVTYSEMIELCNTFLKTDDFYTDQQSITAVMKTLRKIYSIKVNRIRTRIFSCMQSRKVSTDNIGDEAYKQVTWAAEDKKFVQLYHLRYVQDKKTADDIMAEIEAADKLFNQGRIIKENIEHRRSWKCSAAYLKLLSVRSNLDGNLYKDVKEYYEKLKKEEGFGIKIATPMFDAMRNHHAYCRMTREKDPEIVEAELLEMIESLMQKGKFDNIGLSIAINALSEIGSEKSLDLAVTIFLNGHVCNQKIYSFIRGEEKPTGELTVDFHIASTDQKTRGIPTNLASRITELIMSNLQPAQTVTIIHGCNGGTTLKEALQEKVEQMNNKQRVGCGIFSPRFSMGPCRYGKGGRSIIGRIVRSNTIGHGICPISDSSRGGCRLSPS